MIKLNDLSRRNKQVAYFASDWLVAALAVYLAYCLRFSTFNPIGEVRDALPVILGVSLCAPVVIAALRLQNIKLSSLDVSATVRLAQAGCFLGLLTVVLCYLMALWTPRSVPILIAILFFALSALGRNTVLTVLTSRGTGAGRKPVAIYGAGAAGMQLASALNQSREFKPTFMVDDNPSLHGILISGLRVHHPDYLQKKALAGEIQQVVVAAPSLSDKERQGLIGRLSDLPIEVRVLPSYVELLEDKTATLRTVSPDEILNRDKVDLDTPLIAEAYSGRVVMITGAGGSIGSELCRQVIECKPAGLVFYEQSELALYTIDKELRAKAETRGIHVTSRLGSVADPVSVRSALAESGVEIVLHAAAYKHVPLVESNEVQGVQNNVIGTQVVAQAAMDADVERFILVSTDKAVRPTNIMGATKRMAEMVVQDLQTRSSKTMFSMVRFGNVLGSSGSVLPLFQEQIRAGGPVTVTHPEVTRFFMTIPEAARLVLLAGAFAQGGDVFVLDMGKPVKIYDIAKRMIKIAGARVKDDAHPDGIAIEFVGLRPGEKLYEELLIDDKTLVSTPHEKILRAREASISEIEIASMLKDIRAAIVDGNGRAVRETVQAFVKGYHIKTPEEVDAKRA